ncbi:MAG: ATP-binding cassette domain-containing protein, partial [Acutalibacteraceae bacterium]
MICVKTENLTKKYKDTTAVDSLNIEVNDGEIFALLGVNGAGKTTAVKMLSCLITPTSGDAKIYGYSIKTEREKVKEIINVAPQETAVAPNLSVFENLELFAGLYGKSKTEAKKAAEK